LILLRTVELRSAHFDIGGLTFFGISTGEENLLEFALDEEPTRQIVLAPPPSGNSPSARISKKTL
jgi:hypothetical protein